MTIEYLAQTYGFPKIVEALKLYGKGKETPEVLRRSPARRSRSSTPTSARTSTSGSPPYAGTFKLPTRGFDDVTKLEIAADAAPKDAKAKANVALGYYYGGDADKARRGRAGGARARSQAADRALHPRRDRASTTSDAREGASSSTSA